MKRRLGVASVLVALALTGCGDGTEGPNGNPFSTDGPDSSTSTSPEPSDPETDDQPTKVTQPEGPSVAPPGIDPTVLADFTGGTNARMLGIWHETVVLASSNAQGQNVLQGHSVETGEMTWEYVIESKLGTGAVPSTVTSEVQYDAISVLETWQKDRLDQLGRLTLLDPTRGTVRSAVDIGAAREIISFVPFGVVVQPWHTYAVVYLPDGRQVSLSVKDAAWLLPSPRGTKPWFGTRGQWPGVSPETATEALESVNWNRAVRRTEGEGEQMRVEIIDSVTRKVVAQGCAGVLGTNRSVVFSPSRTWAAVGGAVIEVATQKIHCNIAIQDAVDGTVLAINDDGRVFGYLGFSDPKEYFLAEPDGELQMLDVADANSTFNPEAEDVARRIAMTDEVLVVDGKTFALPD